jgi:hypothetical protein
MSAGDSFLKWEQRAEQAENELRALKLSHERLRKECMEAEARAEHAEKVRDGERLAREGAQQHRRDAEARLRETTERNLLLIAARDRAEADNAALEEAYRRTWGCVMHDNVVHSPACNDRTDGRGDCTPECPALRVSELFKADHPGAALLEYVKAAERLRSLAAHDEACRFVEDWGHGDSERCALCAFEALKERTP